MHQPIPTQGLWLKQVVTGHFAYYAVPTNSRALSAFRHYVTDLWRRTLRRRSQKDGFTWERMTKLVDVWLPQPRILHPWPDVRFDAVTPLVPKPLTSGAKADGRFGKQDFVYDAGEDVYRCPAGEKLTWRYWNVEAGRKLHNYWTTKCTACGLKSKCTPAKERRVKRWEHEAVLDAMQERLDRAPKTMRIRRQTAEHPFGTIKAWMGATHFRLRTLEKVSAEMSLHVLAYNLKRMIAILGVQPLIQAMRAA